MGTLERITQLFERLRSYPTWQVGLELMVIGAVVYTVYRFVHGTRAAGALKGLIVVAAVATLLVRVVGEHEAFARLRLLYESFITIAAVGLIVIFQPELRRALTRLGETPVFRRAGVSTGTGAVAEAVAEAAGYLSKARFGALIVIERRSELGELVEGGVRIGAEVSAPLLQTIFFPGSALHDLAVVIRGSEIRSAGVQLPLADARDMPDASLGSRHRAAVGVSRESDAVVVVVSEETGQISIAERGQLDRGLKKDELARELLRRLRARAADGSNGGEEGGESAFAGLLEEEKRDGEAGGGGVGGGVGGSVGGGVGGGVAGRVAVKDGSAGDRRAEAG